MGTKNECMSKMHSLIVHFVFFFGPNILEISRRTAAAYLLIVVISSLLQKNVSKIVGTYKTVTVNFRYMNDSSARMYGPVLTILPNSLFNNPYRHVVTAYRNALVEQRVEDINQVGSAIRLLISLPFSSAFGPPPGNFSYGHIQYGDKVSLPRSMLTYAVEKNLEPPWQLILRASNGRFCSCSPLDFRSPSNYIFLPGWMIEHLRLKPRDVVTVEYARLPEVKTMKLKMLRNEVPHSVLPNQELLEKELRHYSSVTKGAFIVVKIAGEEYIMQVVSLGSGVNLPELLAGSIQDSDIATDIVVPSSES